MTAPNTSGGPSAADIREEKADLEKLGDELGPLGCKTVLVTQDGRAPFLDVLDPAHIDTRATRVRAQADYFWGPHGHAIAAREPITAAATVIARSLGLAGGQP